MGMTVTPNKSKQQHKPSNLHKPLIVADAVLEILALAGVVLGLTGLAVPLALLALLVKLLLLSEVLNPEES